MTTAAQTQTLLGAIVLVAGMAALVWLTLARVARVAPRASLAMACANAGTALALGLHALRGVLPDALTLWPGDVLAVASFAMLGAAVQAITTRRLSWKPGAAVVVAAALLMLAAGLTAWRRHRAAGARRPRWCCRCC